MLMKKLLRLALLGLSLFVALPQILAQSSPAMLTPQLDSGYAGGVSGHALGRLSAECILMVGGCNFPDVPAAEGGAKRYYSDVYMTRALSAGEPWQRLGHLPQGIAYAASEVWEEWLIIAGGQTQGEEALRSVYALAVGEDGTLRTERLPDLPEPRSGMASALLGSRLYLVGGSVQGRLSSSVISLDLDNTDEGWREERPYPGPPLLKVLAVGQWLEEEPHLVLWGAFSRSEGESGVSTSLTFCSLNVGEAHAQWVAHPLPFPSMREGATFGGGVMLSHGEEEIALLGGVHEQVFLPALQRAQAMRRAGRVGDRKTLERLSAESRAYLQHDAAWYRFAPFMLVYNFATKKWHQDLRDGNMARADAAYLEGKIVGGELKPGVRTSRIDVIQP